MTRAAYDRCVDASLGTTDEEVRTKLAELVISLDPDDEYEVRHEEFVADLPQSGERIRGREAMREMQREFPPEARPQFSVKRIIGTGDRWVAEATGDYGGQIFHVVVLLELRDGLIVRETRYYAEPFEAPEWRSRWVEPIPDR
jgi:hypothetical protein